MDVFYIVTGWRRSGTSMMMRALEAGGMPVCYDKYLDSIRNSIRADTTYSPNPYGYYEIERDHYPSEKDFLDVCRNKAIKLLYPENTAPYLLPPNCKVVVMVRSSDDIIASFDIAFKGGLRNQPEDQTLSNNIISYWKGAILIGIDVVFVKFEDVIVNPMQEFKKIQQAGWDIDVEKAVKAVDKTLYKRWYK